MQCETASTKAPAIRVYRTPAALAKLDQRTREARMVRETRSALVTHVGGSPSATQRMLIDRACQLTLRIATMDRRFAETGTQTEYDSRTYLAWSNTLARTLKLLGMKGEAEKPPSLAEYIASRPTA